MLTTGHWRARPLPVAHTAGKGRFTLPTAHRTRGEGRVASHARVGGCETFAASIAICRRAIGRRMRGASRLTMWLKGRRRGGCGPTIVEPSFGCAAPSVVIFVVLSIVGRCCDDVAGQRGARSQCVGAQAALLCWSGTSCRRRRQRREDGRRW